MLFCSSRFSVGSNSSSSSSSSGNSNQQQQNQQQHGGGNSISDEEFDPALNEGPIRIRRNQQQLQMAQTSQNSNIRCVRDLNGGNCSDSKLSMSSDASIETMMINGGYLVRSLTRDVWYLIFSFMSTNWFFLNGRLVCKEWHELIRKRGIYSPKFVYYISRRDVKKELKRCVQFVNLCREGYFKQVSHLTIHSDCLLENGGLLRLLFGVSNSNSKERIMKGCSTKHEEESNNHNNTTIISPRTLPSPRENDSSNETLFGLNRICKNCEKILYKQNLWVKLLKTEIPTYNYFPKLTCLNLSYEFPIAKSIITSPFISSLTELNLGSGHVVTDDDIKEIVNTPRLSKLKSLSLYHNQITEHGAFEISNSFHMSNLTSLELGLNRIGTNGFLHLVNSSILKSLTHLDVNRNEVNFNSIQEINSKESNLKTLILLKNDLGVNGSFSFLNHANFPHLAHLNISNTNIGLEGIQNFCKCSYLTNLTILEAGNNEIGDEGVKSICTSPYLVQLKQLDLINNRIGPNGAYSIATCLSNLTNLDLSNFGNENLNQIGNEGAFSIANSPKMVNLTKLCLRRNNIGEAASKAVENSEFLTNLVNLDMRYNEMDMKRNRNVQPPRRPYDDSTCIIA